MANGDRPPVDVEFLVVDAETVAAVQTLRGKRFVQLYEIDVVDAEPLVLQQARHGEHRANAHFIRLASRRGKATEIAHRFETQLLGALFAHQHGHRGAIGKLRGIPGRDRPVFFKRGPEFAQAFERCGGAVALIAIHHAVDHFFRPGLSVDLEPLRAHGRDLVSDQARFLGLGVPQLTLQGVFVLGFAGHLIAPCHHFGGIPHGHEYVGLFFQ